MARICFVNRCACRLLYWHLQEVTPVPAGHYEILHTIDFSVHGSGDETVIEYRKIEEERDADS